MSRKYYVKDEKGTIFSSDGQTKYKVITGNELYIFLKSKERQGKYFYCFRDNNDDIIGLECTEAEYKAYESERRHTAYLRKQEEIYGFSKISVNLPVKETEKEVEIIETIEDTTTKTDELFFKKELYEKLRKAMDSLNEEEFDLIVALFCLEEPMTEREYAKKIGVTQATVNYRKKQILEKMKSFL